MYLFGGSGGMCENMDLYELDLQNFRWTKLKPVPLNGDQSHMPQTRDEHSCVVYDGSLVVFGGFRFGEKTNTTYRYHIKKNTWEQISYLRGPSPRVGRSAVVYSDDKNGDQMIVFGGKDNENDKLNDIWSFNFETKKWNELKGKG